MIEGTQAKPEPEVPLRRNREFQILWATQSASELGSAIALLGYPLLILADTGSAATAGVVSMAAQLAGLVLRLPAGSIADHADRRRIIMLADGCRAVAMAVLAVALAAGAVPLWLVVAAACAESAGHEFVRFAERAALGAVVPARQLPGAVARSEARLHGAGLLGPSVGGWLFALGQALPFVANAVSYAVSAAGMLFIRKPLQERSAAERRAPAAAMAKGIVEGLRWLRGQPVLRVFLLWAAVANLVFGAVSLAVLAGLTDQKVRPGTIGLIITLVSVGGLAGALAAPFLARLVGPAVLLIGVAWILPAVVAVLATVTAPWQIGVLFGLAVFCVPLVNVLLGAYQVALTPDQLRGRVGSLSVLAAGLLQPFGPLLGGVLYDWAGPRAGYLILTTMLGVTALLFTMSREIRRLRPPGED